MTTIDSDIRVVPHHDPAQQARIKRQNGAARTELHTMTEALCATVIERCARNEGRFDPELCQLLALLPDVCRAEDPWLVRQATIAVTYLTRDDANRHSARGLVEKLAFSLGLRKRVPAVHVMAGLGCFLLILTVVGIGLGVLWQSLALDLSNQSAFYLFNVSPWLVIAVGAAGGLGSMVSMFSRLGSYASLTDMDVRELWLLGAVKPVMGVVFALFVFAVLQSGILPFKFEEGPRANYTFLALAFIAGFSERVSHVVASKVEERMLGSTTALAKTP
jgi:hypothetical protein